MPNRGGDRVRALVQPIFVTMATDWRAFGSTMTSRSPTGVIRGEANREHWAPWLPPEQGTPIIAATFRNVFRP